MKKITLYDALTEKEHDALAERELTLRSLNDAFRRSFTHSETWLSSSIEQLDSESQYHIIEGVRLFRTFNAFNDPDRSHNRGRFIYNSLDITWGIHCFDKDMKNESLDPLDVVNTKRHMMIMLTHEFWENLPREVSQL